MTGNGTVCPDPFLPFYPIANPALEARYVPVRLCINGCCAPCIPQVFSAGETGILLKTLEVVAFINFSGCAFLLLSRVLIPARHCRLNAHSIFHFIGIALFSSSIAWFMVASPAQTWCYNSITRSDWFNNWRCTLQGVLYVFGIHSMLLWLCVRILALYLGMCHRRDLGIWLPTALVFGISLIFSLVSIPFTQYNRLNLVCSPVGGGPSIGLVLAPLLVYVVIASSTQVLNAVHITRTVISLKLSSDTGAEVDLRTKIGIERMTMLRKTRTRRILTALRTAAKLQWRTIIFSIFLMLSTVFLAIDFLIIEAHRERGQVADGLSEWPACVMHPSQFSTPCNNLLPISFPVSRPVSRIVAGYILMMLAGILLLLIEVRVSLLRAWCFLLRHPQAIFVRVKWDEFGDASQTRAFEHSATGLERDPISDGDRPLTPTSFRAMDYIVRHVDDVERKETTREQSRSSRKISHDIPPTDQRSQTRWSSKRHRRFSRESAASANSAKLPPSGETSVEDGQLEKSSTIPHVLETHHNAFATLQDNVDEIKEDPVA